MAAPTTSSGPDFTLEDNARLHPPGLFPQDHSITVIGIDEAGRGPWAGPVTAAAAWINPDALDQLPKGLNDSKKLSPPRRAEIAQALTSLPRDVFCYAAASQSAAVIDHDGILPATFAAMDNAAQGLSFTALQQLTILVDGNLAPPMPRITDGLSWPPSIIPVVKGDARSLSIAAASIIAKETRDQIMKTLDIDHPGYGWANNMGYGTAEHRDGLAKQGPTQHHRLSYKPVALVASTFGYTRS